MVEGTPTYECARCGREFRRTTDHTALVRREVDATRTEYEA